MASRLRKLSMFASMPMYDWPEIADATDAFWAAMARELGAEATLWRGEPFTAAWHRDDLLFSQTCGYPFTHEFRGAFTYVATPHYKADGCVGAEYCSILFARRAGSIADFAGSVAAVNTPDSMSGMLAMRLVTGAAGLPHPFFREERLSGSHVNSLVMVQEGKADMCAIDAVCVALARRYRPELLDGLVELARSPHVPGLPYVSRAGDVDRLRKALASVFADEALATVRDHMLLTGFSVLEPSAYDLILRLEQDLTLVRVSSR